MFFSNSRPQNRGAARGFCRPQGCKRVRCFCRTVCGENGEQKKRRGWVSAGRGKWYKVKVRRLSVGRGVLPRLFFLTAARKTGARRGGFCRRARVQVGALFLPHRLWGKRCAPLFKPQGNSIIPKRKFVMTFQKRRARRALFLPHRLWGKRRGGAGGSAALSLRSGRCFVAALSLTLGSPPSVSARRFQAAEKALCATFRCGAPARARFAASVRRSRSRPVRRFGGGALARARFAASVRRSRSARFAPVLKAVLKKPPALFF